jgi:hypothetical protein
VRECEKWGGLALTMRSANLLGKCPLQIEAGARERQGASQQSGQENPRQEKKKVVLLSRPRLQRGADSSRSVCNCRSSWRGIEVYPKAHQVAQGKERVLKALDLGKVCCNATKNLRAGNATWKVKSALEGRGKALGRRGGMGLLVGLSWS